MLSNGIPPVCINVHFTVRLPLTLVNVTLCSSGAKYNIITTLCDHYIPVDVVLKMTTVLELLANSPSTL